MAVNLGTVDSLPGDDVPVGDLTPLEGRLIQSSSGNYKEARFVTGYGLVRMQASGDPAAMDEYEGTAKVAVGALPVEELRAAVNLFDIGRRAVEAHAAAAGSSSTDPSDFGLLLERSGLSVMQEIVEAIAQERLRFTDLAGVDLVRSVGASLRSRQARPPRGAVDGEGRADLTIRVTFEPDTSALGERPVKWRALIDPRTLPSHHYEAEALSFYITKGVVLLDNDGNDYQSSDFVTKFGSATVSAYTRGNGYQVTPYGYGNL